MPHLSASRKRVLVVGAEVAAPASSESGHFAMEVVAGGWDALERVQSGSAPDLIVIDSGFSSEGLHILRWLRRIYPEGTILLVGRHEDPLLRQECIRLGARDFLVHPELSQSWQVIVERYLNDDVERTEHSLQLPEMEQVGDALFFIAASPTMSKLRAQADLLAQVNAPVLIVGEPGSGKELVARLIHKLSVRSGSPFLRINCAALPGDLLNRELFGNAGGGNSHTRPGKFEFCQKGTLFLDGVTDLPLNVQANLLAILQNGYSATNGSTHCAPDVRILASADPSITEAVTERRIREDFYYRLSVFTVNVPSLRERREEVPVLLACFMNQLAKRYALPVPSISSSLHQACKQYAWPGNLRELELFAKQFLVSGDQDLALQDLERSTRRALAASHFAGNGVAVIGNSDHPDDRVAGLKWLVQSTTGATEKNAIAAALSRTHWNRKAAARLLKISYRGLLYKIERYRLSPRVENMGGSGRGQSFGSNGTDRNGH